MGSSVDVLMIGHVARDRLVVDGRAEIAAGGAVYYGGVVLCRLGLSVAVVTRRAARDDKLLAPLRDAGAAVYTADSEETSGIENVYRSADMERRICTPMGFAGSFEVGDLPELSARIVAVVPLMAGEVSLEMLELLGGRGPLALDAQGFVRQRRAVTEAGRSGAQVLVSAAWDEMAEGLRHVTYLKVDRAEAELLTGETRLERAAEVLADYGPHEIVLTETSGVTVWANGYLCRAPFRSRALRGRTGRGDTCFATYLGKRLSLGPEEACQWAGAVTTLKQEQPGPWDGDPGDVERYLAGGFAAL